MITSINLIHKISYLLLILITAWLILSSIHINTFPVESPVTTVFSTISTQDIFSLYLLELIITSLLSSVFLIIVPLSVHKYLFPSQVTPIAVKVFKFLVLRFISVEFIKSNFNPLFIWYVFKGYKSSFDSLLKL